MNRHPTRRFTDREVAAVLRHAADLDERAGSVEGGGLSMEDLREIAAEVGISADSIDRAVAALDRPRPIDATWWSGAPAARRAVRAVPGELEDGEIARLVQVVDERHAAGGAVSEALGSVRWTGSDRISASVVSFTREGGETAIQVVEKINPRIKRVVQLMPGAWGAMLAAPFVGVVGGGTMASLGLLGGGVALGLGAGRVAWNVMSRLARGRVERLADELSDEGARLLPAPRDGS